MPDVFDLIGSIAKRVDRLQTKALAEADLTAAQYLVLANLHDKDRRPLGELADALRCSKSTITGVVDTMERKGLVTREPNPADRRSHLLRLTDKGKALRRSTPELDEAFASCGPCLDQFEFERLRELLARLDRTMSEMGVGA
jgi:DNA-binding MarR family transcriptional regulator